MKAEERHNWSRHYDNIQWTIKGLYLAATGALLFAATFNVWLAVLGIVLTVLVAYYTSSCRRLRRQVQNGLPEEELQLILTQKGLINQWPVNALIYISIVVIWGVLLFNHHADLVWLWTFICFIAVVLVGWLFKIGQ